MRILQVCPYDWHAPGGVQTHVRALTDELRSRGHDVSIAAPGQGADNDADVHLVGTPVGVRFNGTRAPIAPQPSVAWRVRRLMRAFNPAIVHVHEPFTPSAACYAALLTSAPVVATFHAHCDLRIGPWLYSLGTWPLNRRVAAGIAVSPAAIRCLSRRVRVRFQNVPNGVGRRFFDVVRTWRADARERRILFAHRLEPRKGFGVALEAFERIARVDDDAVLIVVGDGDERTRLTRLPAAVRARVRMRGTVPAGELDAEFAAASVFIAPAVHGESFGVVLLEAMAAGVPVVATDVTGYRDVLAGGGGVLVPPGDPAALAAEVGRLLRSPETARAIGAEGRVRAACYSWDRLTGEIETIYREVIDSFERRAAR